MNIQIKNNQIEVLQGKEMLKQKKITGTRLATVLGLNKFNSPFSAWAEMTGLYKPVIPDKYLKVGQVLEKPIIKSIEDMYDYNIKTFDKNEIKFEYWYQAQLYCELAKLDEILFGVCFVEDKDYADPNNIPIDDRDIRIYPVQKVDIKPEMEKAIEWYKEYMQTFKSPKFDSRKNRDMEIVNEIKKNWRIK